MNIHKIKQENTQTGSLAASTLNHTPCPRAGQLGEPLKERIIWSFGRKALGLGVGVGLGVGLLLSPNQAFAQNKTDSTQVVADSALKVEAASPLSANTTKKTSVYESSRGLAYEYLICASGRTLMMPNELEAYDTNNDRVVQGVALFGSFVLNMNDGRSDRVNYLLVFEDKVAWMSETEKNSQWNIAQLGEVATVQMLKTAYELRIKDSPEDLRLLIRRSSNTACAQKGDVGKKTDTILAPKRGEDEYGEIRFRRHADSLEIGEFSRGELLEQMVEDGRMPGEPLLESMFDGYPRFKPQWKEMRLALPREGVKEERQR